MKGQRSYFSICEMMEERSAIGPVKHQVLLALMVLEVFSNLSNSMFILLIEITDIIEIIEVLLWHQTWTKSLALSFLQRTGSFPPDDQDIWWGHREWRGYTDLSSLVLCIPFLHLVHKVFCIFSAAFSPLIFIFFNIFAESLHQEM